MSYDSYYWREWEEYFPDDDERAEAQERMKSLAERYDPHGVEYNGEPGKGFSILVIDEAGGVNSFWIDLWVSGNNVDFDWNDVVINVSYSCGQWYELQQGDRVIAEKAFDAAFEYAEQLGLIVQLPNGDWRYANPDEYAVRRDAVVSLARKARANRAKGVGKITGRFRF